MADRPTGSVSDYLAAERTLLAWIRTGLALMGFGFVVARFGLFLQALRMGQSNFPTRPYGPSFWFGTALIVLGVLVNIMCARNHVRLVNELKRGEPMIHRPSSLAVAVAILLAVLGVAMAIYLISVREPIPPPRATSTAASGLPDRLAAADPTCQGIRFSDTHRRKCAHRRT